MTGSIIYINDICNQNCVFCCGIGKKMSKDKYKPIIDKAKRRLIISGGEPPISKDLSVILKLSKENKNIKEIELQSNGAIFLYKKIINKIEKHKSITEYNINFPSFDKETDKIITKSTFFGHRVKGIKNLIDKRLNVRLTFVINKLNYKQMTNYLRFIYKEFNNKPSVQFSFIQIQGNVIFNDIAPQYKNIKSELIKSLKFAKENKIKCFVDNIPLCISHPYNDMNINYLKKKIGDTSFYEKKKVNQCKNCKLNEMCFGPPTDYVGVYGEKEFKPIK